MGLAATVTNDSAQHAPSPREFSAFLRLRQGGAARTTWLLTESPGGTMISVGADAACDWQIRAAFVPARAFSVLVVGERAFVRSGPEPGLLLDGKPVDDSWAALAGSARIDVGLARFEVQTGYAEPPSEEPVLLTRPRARELQVDARSAAAMIDDVALANTAVGPRLVTPARTPSTRRKSVMETQGYAMQAIGNARVQAVGLPRAQERLAQVVQDVQERFAQAAQAAQATLVTPPASARAQVMSGSTMELNLDDLDYAGTIPMSRGDQRSSEYTVSPSLLGGDEITHVTGGMGGWRYVMMGAFFACAYGAWLYLLDRI